MAYGYQVFQIHLQHSLNVSKSDLNRNKKQRKIKPEDILYSQHAHLLVSSVYLLYTRLLKMSQGATTAKAADT